MQHIPVIHFGLGPIGQTIGRTVAETTTLESVGAVDIDDSISGRLLDEVCGGRLPPLTVQQDLLSVQAPEGSVLLQATVSRLDANMPILLEAIARGYHVVSTCEELGWPWHDYPDQARALDEAARGSGVVIIGVGVNPGFIMDTLPLLLSYAASEIEAIHISRYVDLNERRLQLQRKMGLSQDPRDVKALLDAERIGHVGLSTSLHMLAAGMGWHIDVVDLINRPIPAAEPTQTGVGLVKTGDCIGIKQQALGFVQGTPRIILNLVMQVGVDGGTRDEFLIDGDQTLHGRIGGIQGDLATAALVVNFAQRAPALAPGLQTMISVPLQPTHPPL